jgi:NTP pyrophosphatase (non-canonical NTP hydrolase)
MNAINRITGDDLENFVKVPTMTNYQRIATKSAIYPGQGTALGLAYCALKLNGEAGEAAEHVGKAMRDDDLVPLDTLPGREGLSEVKIAFLGVALAPARKTAIIKEVGDVLWYLSAICNELGITLEAAAATNLQKLYSRTERNVLQGEGDER